MYFIFSTPVLIRHLWQLKTVVFLHWYLMYLICAVLLGNICDKIGIPFLPIISKPYPKYNSTLPLTSQ